MKSMKAHNYKWLLVFFMLWLPVQGAVAAILSVCVQETKFDHPRAAIDNSHHHDGCHKQAAENTTDHWLDSLPCDDTSCNAYSSTPIVSSTAPPVTAHAISAITPYESGFTSFVPDQPQHPPLIVSL